MTEAQARIAVARAIVRLPERDQSDVRDAVLCLVDAAGEDALRRAVNACLSVCVETSAPAATIDAFRAEVRTWGRGGAIADAIRVVQPSLFSAGGD